MDLSYFNAPVCATLRFGAMMMFMGFALWIDGDIASAQGTHEYRPMGVAHIAETDVFKTRDFDRYGRLRPRTDSSFVGLFASLSHVNRFLADRRSQPKRKKLRPGSKRTLAII
jgi:hypothetical protein